MVPADWSVFSLYWSAHVLSGLICVLSGLICVHLFTGSASTFPTEAEGKETRHFNQASGRLGEAQYSDWFAVHCAPALSLMHFLCACEVVDLARWDTSRRFRALFILKASWLIDTSGQSTARCSQTVGVVRWNIIRSLSASDFEQRKWWFWAKPQKNDGDEMGSSTVLTARKDQKSGTIADPLKRSLYVWTQPQVRGRRSRSRTFAAEGFARSFIHSGSTVVLPAERKTVQLEICWRLMIWVLRKCTCQVKNSGRKIGTWFGIMVAKLEPARKRH